MVVEEAAKRKWQVTAHTAGEGAMDVLLDAYEFVNRVDADQGPALLHHARQLPVAAQPGTLQGARRRAPTCSRPGCTRTAHTLLNVLGPERMRWFQPYKSWLEYTTIGGGSDHMLRFDPLDSTNPWNPWLGIWVAADAQARTRRRARARRAPDPRAGAAAVHDQQRLPAPRGEGEGQPGSRASSAT